MERFYADNGKLAIKSHKITMRRYTDLEKSDYQTYVEYVTDDELTEWTVNFVPKHALWEVVSVEDYDNSAYEWAEGITLRTNNYEQEIKDIIACGSIEAYEASLPEAQNELMLDMGVEIAMLKLGINEEV